MKAKRTTLTASDLRKIREVFQAELIPLKNELKKLRKDLDKRYGSGSIG